MVTPASDHKNRSALAKRVLYSSVVLSIVTGAVAVLGAPVKWT